MVVEEKQFYAGCASGIQREIYAVWLNRCPQRMGRTLFNLECGNGCGYSDDSMETHVVLSMHYIVGTVGNDICRRRQHRRFKLRLLGKCGHRMYLNPC